MVNKSCPFPRGAAGCHWPLGFYVTPEQDFDVTVHFCGSVLDHSLAILFGPVRSAVCPYNCILGSHNAAYFVLDQTHFLFPPSPFSIYHNPEKWRNKLLIITSDLSTVFHVNAFLGRQSRHMRPIARCACPSVTGTLTSKKSRTFANIDLTKKIKDF